MNQTFLVATCLPLSFMMGLVLLLGLFFRDPILIGVSASVLVFVAFAMLYAARRR